MKCERTGIREFTFSKVLAEGGEVPAYRSDIEGDFINHQGKIVAGPQGLSLNSLNFVAHLENIRKFL